MQSKYVIPSSEKNSESKDPGMKIGNATLTKCFRNFLVTPRNSATPLERTFQGVVLFPVRLV